MAEIKRIFGVDYYVYVIEFQKRGLPHAHIVFKAREFFCGSLEKAPFYSSVCTASTYSEHRGHRQYSLRSHPNPTWPPTQLSFGPYDPQQRPSY